MEILWSVASFVFLFYGITLRSKRTYASTEPFIGNRHSEREVSSSILHSIPSQFSLVFPQISLELLQFSLSCFSIVPLTFLFQLAFFLLNNRLLRFSSCLTQCFSSIITPDTSQIPVDFLLNFHLIFSPISTRFSL